MPVKVKKSRAALKHGGYTAMTVLPSESVAEFEDLHRDLIAELNPSGALEDDTVATMARLLWRRSKISKLVDWQSEPELASINSSLRKFREKNLPRMG